MPLFLSATCLIDPSCSACPLATQRSQVVQPTLRAPGGLLCIGEALGAAEDAAGEGFVGAAGKKLAAMLAVEGIGPNDYSKANLVACRPPANRKPTPMEMRACAAHLAAAIMACRPKVILCVGGSATAQILGAGSLFTRIEQSRYSSFNDFRLASEALRIALAPWLTSTGGCHCIPMPHSSGLSMNRNAPNGVRWSVIGQAQIRLASECLAG